jgi:hypothetical protein
VISIESRLVGGREGGPPLFLFYNAASPGECDCARVLSDYSLTQHGV